MFTVLWHCGKLHLPGLLQRQKQFIILVPSVHSGLIDLLSHLKLRIEVSRIHITGKIRGTEIHPPVLVHLSSEILAPVRPLLPQNFRLLNIGRILDEKSSSLAHAEILGFMKAVAPKVPDGAKGLSLVSTHNCLGGILHHLKAMASRDLHNPVHLAGNSRIMHHKDGFCPFRHGRLNQSLINIHGIRPNIHKHRLRSPQYEGICRGHKGIRGENHLIPLLKVTQ